MSSCLSQCKEDIRNQALRLGASACGFAKAEIVDDNAQDLYNRWIDGHRHGTMDYCAKYMEERNDPRLLLDGAKTVISCAFSYFRGDSDLPLSAHISRYAWGKDYHQVLRSKLNHLADFIMSSFGGRCRICVDTAPIRERYWAQKAGVGFVGMNNQLIIPNHGSYFFLGEVLWTGETDPDQSCDLTCEGCGLCLRRCPSRALMPDGSCDSSKCLSYLTIEYRGEIAEGLDLVGNYYGCDVCQKVCPHNKTPLHSGIEDFDPDFNILSLQIDDLKNMSSSHFRKLTRQSSMNRVTLKQILRNIEHAKQR